MPIQATEVVIDLPEGQDYIWFDEFNIVGLSSRLDDAGRACALLRCREEHPQESPACRVQQPTNVPSQRNMNVPLTCLSASLAYVERRPRHSS